VTAAAGAGLENLWEKAQKLASFGEAGQVSR